MCLISQVPLKTFLWKNHEIDARQLSALGSGSSCALQLNFQKLILTKIGTSQVADTSFFGGSVKDNRRSSRALFGPPHRAVGGSLHLLALLRDPPHINSYQRISNLGAGEVPDQKVRTGPPQTFAVIQKLKTFTNAFWFLQDFVLEFVPGSGPDFTWTLVPDPGPDCFIRAEFARQLYRARACERSCGEREFQRRWPCPAPQHF